MSNITITGGNLLLNKKSIGIELPFYQPSISLYSDDPRPELRVDQKPERVHPDQVADKTVLRLNELLENPPTNFLIDSMLITAGSTGVGLLGRNKIVSNNRIEVANSWAGIYLFGPDNIIENNILIFRGDRRAPSAALIKLHRGHNTIIRNNIFIVEDSENAPEHVVTVINSNNVQITGNRIYGVKQIVRRFGDFSEVSESDNTLEPQGKGPRLFKWMRRADQVKRRRTLR